VARPNFIELGDAVSIPILFEDRSVMAIDKPVGWMLVPYSWDRTSRNLQLAISSSILGGEFWARSRGLKFLKHVHRLDAETSGVLLFAKSQGALNTFSEMFESRRMMKRYLAVVRGIPKKPEWVCDAKLGPHPDEHGRHRVDPNGKESETHFKVLDQKDGLALIEARPVTGRTHQIRLHLTHAGLPIVGDTMYGSREDRDRRTALMGLRAVCLEYVDPFTRRRIQIRAPEDEFVAQFFAGDVKSPIASAPASPASPLSSSRTSRPRVHRRFGDRK
jgi:23S rRNA pseudouridine1911/1915/1917 synthase